MCLMNGHMVRVFSFLPRCVAVLAAVLLLAAPIRVHADNTALAKAMSEQALGLLSMTKSACLIIMGAPPEFHQNAIVTRTTVFEEHLELLSNALEESENLNVVLTQAPIVVASVNQIGAGDTHSIPFRLMLSLSGPVMNSFLPLIQDQGVSSDVTLVQAVTTVMQLKIDSQAMLLDLCLNSADLEGDKPTDRLKRHLDVFEQQVVDLIDGNPDKNIDKAPSIQVKFALKDVLTKWKSVRPVLEKSVNGDYLPVDEIMLASVSVDAMIQKLSKALDQYAKL